MTKWCFLPSPFDWNRKSETRYSSVASAFSPKPSEREKTTSSCSVMSSGGEKERPSSRHCKEGHLVRKLCAYCDLHSLTLAYISWYGKSLVQSS